jgi:hypothetical protein
MVLNPPDDTPTYATATGDSSSLLIVVLVDERDWPEELDLRIATVATADDPYQAALKVTGCAVDYLVTSVVASRLYQVWAALQDWLELKAGEEADALAAMRRAASEWLVAKDDRAAREAYLDHWQYTVLGYERPS